MEIYKLRNGNLEIVDDATLYAINPINFAIKKLCEFEPSRFNPVGRLVTKPRKELCIIIRNKINSLKNNES